MTGKCRISSPPATGTAKSECSEFSKSDLENCAMFLKAFVAPVFEFKLCSLADATYFRAVQVNKKGFPVVRYGSDFDPEALEGWIGYELKQVVA